MFRCSGSQPPGRPIPLFKKLAATQGQMSEFCLGASRWRLCHCTPCRTKQGEAATETAEKAEKERLRLAEQVAKKKEELSRRRAEIGAAWTAELAGAGTPAERRAIIEKQNLLFKKLEVEFS